MTERRTNLLLTGRPGIGKTTVLCRVAERLDDREIAGFVTEEIRDGGRRVGFRGVPLDDGQPRVISHVDVEGPPRVSKYGVDVGAIDALVDETLPDGADLYLVDEIGKMECASERFVARLTELLDSDALLVATIGRGGGDFMRTTRERDDAGLLEVTEANRDELPGRIVSRLREKLGE